MKNMGLKRLERALTIGFRWYGSLVGHRPLPFFIVPLLVSIFVAPGIFFIKYDDDVITLFTPYDAPSRREQNLVKEFSYVQPLVPVEAISKHGPGHPEVNNSDPEKKTRYLLQRAKNHSRANPWLFVDISYANRSNILNPETFHYIWQFVSYIYYNYTCSVTTYPDEHGQMHERTLRYNPDYCDPNDVNGMECPQLDKQFAFLEDLLNESKYQPNPKIRLTYPVMYLWNRPFNWGQVLYGTKVNATDGKLLSATVAALKLQFQYDLNDDDEHLAKQCMSQLTRFVESLNHAPESVELQESYEKGLRFYINNQWKISDEVSLVQTRTSPCTAFTAILVTIFTTLSSYYARSPIMGAVEAILGVLAIGLSLSTTFALLFIFGLPFNFVVTMTPLLTLCVGIDNDFLLMSAWRRPHLEKMKAKQRLAHAFAEAGPSLTITSVNDILCFAVGVLSESPAISDFCLFTSVALALRYLYQLTFFSGALVFISERGPFVWDKFTRVIAKIMPMKRRFFDGKGASHWAHHECNVSSSPSASSEEVPGPSPEPSLDVDDSLITAPEDDHIMHRFFRTKYSDFISHPLTRLVVILLFIAYLAFAFVQSAKLQVNISVTKLFLDKSPLMEHYDIAERFVFSSIIGIVIVNRPPDFRNDTSIQRFMQFVDALERTPVYSPKPVDTTTLWLRDYMDFRQLVAVNEPLGDFYDYMSMFLNNDEYSKYINDIRFNFTHDGRIRVESFQFTTYYQNARTWDDCAILLQLWRRACKNYSEYEAVVHDYFFRNSYLDQRLTLSGTTLQTMGIASLSIALVTSLLMPDAMSMFFICFSSLSVDLGVIGALNLWGSDLDPITMACLLMTIGFSVYYTARICYCYQKADQDWELSRKLAYTLGTVGWPIFQGGLATLIGIIPLVIVPAYMVRTFFRTIVLVVAIGLLHGLLFMPVLMSLYDGRNSSVNAFSRRRQKMQEIVMQKKNRFLRFIV